MVFTSEAIAALDRFDYVYSSKCERWSVQDFFRILTDKQNKFEMWFAQCRSDEFDCSQNANVGLYKTSFAFLLF